MDQKTENTAIAADLDTPVVTILLDRLENNITRVQGMVAAAGKQGQSAQICRAAVCSPGCCGE